MLLSLGAIHLVDVYHIIFVNVQFRLKEGLLKLSKNTIRRLESLDLPF